MKRRNFIQTAGLGAAAAIMLPLPGFSTVDEARLLEPIIDAATKKSLADIALNTAKKLGATYTDVRIGRYLNQFVTTREKKVQAVVNTESFGVGIRVIANGTWGFAASNDVTPRGMRKTAERAVIIAKANSKFQKEPVKLAITPSYGEVSWKTPIVKNGFEVPVKDKVDLLLKANDNALQKGASFVNSAILLVNEQKYFASSEGSYIDQGHPQDLSNFQCHPLSIVRTIHSRTGSLSARQSAWVTNISTVNPKIRSRRRVMLFSTTNHTTYSKTHRWLPTR